MPQFTRHLDVYQGFNFKKDKQHPVGFITKLKIGGLEIKADQESILDPEQPAKPIASKVVGVLSHILWETGITDALHFTAQISVHNKTVIATMLFGDMTNMEVDVSFVVYEYDPVAKKYFKSAFVDADCKGILEKHGHELNLHIADDPSHEVQSPKNYTLQMGVKPQTIKQTVNIATAAAKKFVKQWGNAETKA